MTSADITNGRNRPSDDNVSGRMIGDYVLRARLGQGSGGEVYAAFDHRLARAVAIKHVRGVVAEEARTLARLRHPAIPQIYETFEADGEHYIVSELLNGVSLAELLSVEAPSERLSISRACELLVAISSALAHAHSQGVVHRDIKPGNVVVDSSGAAKLVDFGLAQRSSGPDSNVAPSGHLAGTPGYMSPEQAWARPLDERSDIFSLGVCFYEVLGGVNPFVGADAAATHRNVFSARQE